MKPDTPRPEIASTDSRSVDVGRPKQVAEPREGSTALAHPIVRHPAANSWYRVQVRLFPERCPVCDRKLAGVWQDHHLNRSYTAGWLVGSWQCYANVDGQDCSRFTFVHDGDAVPCEVQFSCQKTRSLRVEEICRQVLAARKALAPQAFEDKRMDDSHHSDRCVYEGDEVRDCGCNCEFCVTNHRAPQKGVDVKDTKLLHAGSLRK